MNVLHKQEIIQILPQSWMLLSNILFHWKQAQKNIQLSVVLWDYIL